MNEPQPLRDFRLAIERGSVSANAAGQFKNWRNGKKFPSEFTDQANALWAKYEKLPKVSSSNKTALEIYSQIAAEQREVQQKQRPSNSATRGNSKELAEPDLFGSPFHNPYTFVPFPEEAPLRHPPTPISIDEEETERFTGVIDLELKLLSPLLTNHPDPVSNHNEHKSYKALCIGNDVVLPATGVRGSLRNLMTILTGGTLGYVDEEAWLCQGRDVAIGSMEAVLAEVVTPGSLERSGKIRLGETRFVLASRLEDTYGSRLPRPGANERVNYLWSNAEGTSLNRNRDNEHPWKVKLSGQPVGGKKRNEKKKEGLFKAYAEDDAVIDIPPALWAAYSGRNRHGDHRELKSGDLVWLEPIDAEGGKIKTASDIASIQWARWGRRGTRLLNLVEQYHPYLMPDAFNPDGKVDEITDLFGQIPREEMCAEISRFSDWKKKGMPGPSPAFAARIRPGNVVFENAQSKVERCTLAPLGNPHPGCAAFYRDAGSDVKKATKTVANSSLPLRGFKVYRTSQERGNKAPWNFAQQPVFDERGQPKTQEQQKINKTVDLLPEAHAGTGRLRITVRALSLRELALLCAACSVDWRLGGGKPLGLGHCRVTSMRISSFNDNTGGLEQKHHINFPASEMSFCLDFLPKELRNEILLDEILLERAKCWQQSQVPVENLRYPRAVAENRYGKTRGGHVWFNRHANPNKSKAGLERFYLDRDLEKSHDASAVRGQPLPHFDPDAPLADLLFGYDLFIGDSSEWTFPQKGGQTLHKKFEPFDPRKHARESDRSGGNQGQSRTTRQGGRRNRNQ